MIFYSKSQPLSEMESSLFRPLLQGHLEQQARLLEVVINTTRGMETIIADEQEQPVPALAHWLHAIQNTRIAFTPLGFVAQLARLPFWYYKARIGEFVWSPDIESFRMFIARGEALFWKDYEAVPTQTITRWLLRHDV